MLMLAQLPIPAIDRFGLPGHPALLLLLYHVTFVLHLLFMNFALGGAVVCLVNEIRATWSANADYLVDLNRRIFLALPVAVSFAVTFGVAPLLFVQALYGQFFYTAMILIGLPWLVVVAVLIVVFYLIYLARFGARPLGLGNRLLRIVITAGIAAGLAAVALVLTSNAVWSITPPQWLAKYRSSSLSFFPAEPHFWYRYAHNLVGGTAMACLLTAAMARALHRRGVVDQFWANRTVAGFLLVAAALTAVQMLVGAGVIVNLRSDVRDDVMLMSWGNLHVWGWRLGVAAAIGAIIAMVRGVSQPHRALWPWLSLGLIVVTLGGMSMARQAVRAGYLDGVQFSLNQWVEPAHSTSQFSPFIVFLLSFVVAIAVVGWMLWVCWHIPPQPAQATTAAAPPPVEEQLPTEDASVSTPSDEQPTQPA